jgi:uncharacterized MnhB-related membrane protein
MHAPALALIMPNDFVQAGIVEHVIILLALGFRVPKEVPDVAITDAFYDDAPVF